MSVTPARAAAQRILRAVRGGVLADLALAKEARGLDAQDRAWLQELVYGTLRLRGRIDHRLGALIHRGIGSVRPDVLDALRLGAYQLLEMDGVPAYAAVSQAVEMARDAAGQGAAKLANGVLRALQRTAADVHAFEDDPAAWLEVHGSHPRWLVDRWIRRWGTAGARRLVDWNNTRPDVFLRPLDVTPDRAAAELREAGIAAEPVAGMRSVRLTEGGDPADALARMSAVVQDPAAGAVVDYAGVGRGDVVADLCAAPGGKALGLATFVGDAGRVVASDRTFGRLSRLRENAGRVPNLPVDVVVADARRPAISEADAVVIDVPCTGTGTFRRHPDARWRLEPEDLEALVALQREILEGAARAVTAGGRLVYATCSLETEENEAQVERFLLDHPEFAMDPGPAPATLLDDGGRLVVLPHVHGFDGAFAARMRRS